jgi:excisionase family DNA binding protein
VDLEAAARKLGVHYQTAYRWVRSGALPAVKVGSEYEIQPEDVERVIEEQRFGRSVAMGVDPDWDAHTAELYEELRAGDEIAAQFLVDRLHAGGAAPLHLCETLISPALTRLGEDFGAGTASSADVALAAGICERLVGALATPPRGRPRGLVVVASPEGELHRLPGLMATAALRAERWRVHHLGADVPAVDLIGFVQASAPDVVVLSLASAIESGVVTRDGVLADCPTRVLLGEPGAPLSRLLEGLP